MTEFAIKFQNVKKTYVLTLSSKADSLRAFVFDFFSKGRVKEFKALQNINCTISRGESVAIIGQNGAGKSTLLKLISRITLPTDGQILLNGKVSSLLEIGTGFHPDLTGEENIFLNGSVLGMRKGEIQTKFKSIIDFAGVSNYLHQPIKHYSSGMKVRLAFAVAAHLDPDILVIDEVLAVGDIEFQEKCISKMQEIIGRGKTVIFISHDARLAKKICHRGIVLEQGKIVFDGNIDESIAFYQSKLSLSKEHLAVSLGTIRTIGNGKFRFSEIWLEDESKNKITSVKSGESMTIRARTVGRENVKANIACRIYNKAGQRITSLTSSYFKQYLNCGNNRTISWEINKLPLTGGLYFLSLEAYEDFGGATPIDIVDSALILRVDDSDYHGCGVSQSPGRNMVYFDFTVS